MPSVELDSRIIGGLKFTTKRAYDLPREDEVDKSAQLSWWSRIPNKVQVFAWLLFRNHLNAKPTSPVRALPPTRIVHIIPSQPRTQGTYSWPAPTPTESGSASVSSRSLTPLMIFGTPRSQQGLITPSGPLCCLPSVENLGCSRCQESQSSRDLHSVATVKLIISDIDLWSHRLSKQSDMGAISSWQIFMPSRIHASM